MQFKMRRDESCKVVCRRHLSQEAAKNFKEKIDDEYRVNMYGFSLQLIPYFFSMSVLECDHQISGRLRICSSNYVHMISIGPLSLSFTCSTAMPMRH